MITNINGNPAAADAVNNIGGYCAACSSDRDITFADQYESVLDDMGLLGAYRTGEYSAVIKLIRSHSDGAEETLRTLAQSYVKAQGQ
jgi:hypothetical protein